MLHSTATTVNEDNDQIGTSHAARILGVSEQRVRQLANAGVLQCTRLSGIGARLCRRQDVRVELERRSADLP